jgi:nucleotide-binding universal stress UspA family protein
MEMAGKKRYLVAIDGSPESKSIVNFAAKMLPPVDTEVVFLHVLNRIPETYWDFGSGVEADSLAQKIKNQVEAHEKAIKRLMADSKQVLLNASFREENIAMRIEDRMIGIARDIVAEARRGYHGLILGCTGMGKMKGLAVGSVSTKINGALTNMPICIVAGSPAGPNLIVALDGSVGSMRALDYVCSVMNGFKGKVVLFHALRHIGYPDPATGRIAPFNEVEKSLWEDARRMLAPTLEEAKERLMKAGCAKDKVLSQVVAGVSSRAAALLEEARKSECSSIFVGRTGISQVEDFNIGRVANKVVHGAQNQAVWIIP